MTRRYRYAMCLNWGGDEPTAELDVEVEYEVAWGAPESGRFGPPENYDPGAGDVVEGIKVLTINGRPGPWEPMDPTETAEQTVIAKLEMDHEEAMIQEATEMGAAEYDAHQESLWEERRLERGR